MDEVCINIKAELTADHNGLTALSQLVAIYTSAGIISATEIAAKTGYTERAVRKAKAELGCRNPGATEPECRNPGSGSGTPVPSRNPSAGTPVPQTESLACADKTTRATNELPSEVLSHRVIDSPVAPTIAKPKRLRSQGSRLPADWELPDDWKVWAQVNCFASDDRIAIEAANFADYWIAKPSQATSLDWKRTWQKWARKAFSAAGNRRPQFTGSYGSPQPKEPVESLSAMMSRMQAEGAFQ